VQSFILLVSKDYKLNARGCKMSMTKKEAMIIVWKKHNFDGLMRDWVFAKDQESMLKARKTYLSVRGVGGDRATLEGIRKQLEEAQQKSFYTIHNITTGEITYHAIDENTLSLRDWMINHLDMSCEYEPHTGYVTREDIE